MVSWMDFNEIEWNLEFLMFTLRLCSGFYSIVRSVGLYGEVVG